MTRGGLALIAIALLVLAASGAVLAPTPADADVPVGLRPALDDARASLLDHGDLIEPGSRLVLTGVRCRADGGVRFTFTNRWLWVIERSYYASSDGPPSGRGSFGGGVLDRADDERDLEDWLRSADEVDCSAADD